VPAGAWADTPMGLVPRSVLTPIDCRVPSPIVTVRWIDPTHAQCAALDTTCLPGADCLGPGVLAECTYILVLL
jgi:hypothetical protein